MKTNKAKKTNTANINKKRVSKKVCPLCAKPFNNLLRHLLVHDLPKEEARAICYSMRKRPKKENVKPKEPRRPKYCPFRLCSKTEPFIRLDKHLRKVHNLTPESDTYKRLIKCRPILHSTDDTDSDKRSSKFSETMASEFFQHLISFDGGSRSEENAKRQSQKLRQILKGIKLINVSDISNAATMNKLQTWFTVYTKQNKHSSAITYFSVLTSFLSYLKDFKSEFVSYQDMCKMISKLKNWQKGFQNMKNAALKFDQEISLEDINIFERSKVYQETMNDLLHGRTNSIPVTLKVYSRVTNLLLFKTIMSRSVRLCALASMTLPEFQRGKIVCVEDETSFVISVRDHKTVAEDDPLEVVLTQETYNLYIKYMSYFRETLSSPIANEEENFFRTWSGQAISPDDINTGIKSLWTAAGLTSMIGCKFVKKTTTARVPSSIEGSKELIARHMGLRLSTAESNYKLMRRKEESVKASKIITRIFKPDINFKLDNHKIDSRTSGSTSSLSTSAASPPSMTTPMKVELTAEYFDEEQNIGESSTSTLFSPSSKVKLTEEYFDQEQKNCEPSSSTSFLPPSKLELTIDYTDEEQKICEPFSFSSFSPPFKVEPTAEYSDEEQKICEPSSSTSFLPPTKLELTIDYTDEEQKICEPFRFSSFSPPFKVEPTAEPSASTSLSPRLTFSFLKSKMTKGERGRFFFSNSEREILFNAFEDSLVSGTVPLLSIIRERMDKDINLVKLSKNKRNVNPLKIKGCLLGLANLVKKYIQKN